MNPNNSSAIDITEIRKARNEAESLRDRLTAEFNCLSRPEDAGFFHQRIGKQRFHGGLEAMRKAIVAANRAIASINQALSQIERVQDE